MTKQKLDNYKKELEEMRIKEAKEREAQEVLQQQQEKELSAPERIMELDVGDEKEVTQIYGDWLKQYK